MNTIRHIRHKEVSMVDFVAERLRDCGVEFERPNLNEISIAAGYEGNTEKALSDGEFVAALTLKSLGFDVRKKS